MLLFLDNTTQFPNCISHGVQHISDVNELNNLLWALQICLSFISASTHYIEWTTWLSGCILYHLSLCVTLARATAKAWTALNGYWKSRVYALPSIRPNCITCRRTAGLVGWWRVETGNWGTGREGEEKRGKGEGKEYKREGGGVSKVGQKTIGRDRVSRAVMKYPSYTSNETQMEVPLTQYRTNVSLTCLPLNSIWKFLADSWVTRPPKSSW